MSNVPTRVIVADYIAFRLRKVNMTWNECPALPEPGSVQRTMQVLGEAFEERYMEVYQGMTNQLHLAPNTAHGSFTTIVNELFRDGIGWGRIVALVAFGGALAVQCIQKEMPGLVNEVVDWVSEYIDSHLMSWIQEQGGWDSFVEFFEGRPDRRDESPWPRVSRFWGIAVGAVGLLTLGAFLSHRS